MRVCGLHTQKMMDLNMPLVNDKVTFNATLFGLVKISLSIGCTGECAHIYSQFRLHFVWDFLKALSVFSKELRAEQSLHMSYSQFRICMGFPMLPWH